MSGDKSHGQVSVVIPCFRCPHTIGRAIESIAEQKLLPLEVILVDDYSNDKDQTLAAIDHCGQWLRDLNINVIKICLAINGGPAVARNSGWDVATQPFVAFLDSDDWWHSKKLLLQFALMSANPSIALTSHHFSEGFTNNGDSKNRLQIRDLKSPKVYLRNEIVTSGVMLKRTLPYRFPVGKRYSEDYQLWLEIINGGHRQVLIEADLGSRFKRPFGDGGLTGHLWRMEQAELSTLFAMCKRRHITSLAFLFFSCFSIAKFLRRIVLSISWRCRPKRTVFNH